MTHDFDARPVLREIWHDLLALLWPVVCVACGAADRDVCGDCLAELERARGQVHRVQTAAGVACVAGPYAGPLRALLVSFKHAGVTRFARVLGAQLAAPLREVASTARSPVLIVVVPSRPARVRERGYQHVEMLVRAALRDPLLRNAELRAGRPGTRPGTNATRTTPQLRLVRRAFRTLPGRTGQVGLRSAERERNAALIALPDRMQRRLRGRPVLLVDDVITTGATVSAAAQKLREAGAELVGIVALGTAVRRDGSRGSTGSAPGFDEMSAAVRRDGRRAQIQVEVKGR